MNYRIIECMIFSYIACGLATILSLVFHGSLYKMYKIITSKSENSKVSNIIGLSLTICSLFTGWILVNTKNLIAAIDKEYDKCSIPKNEEPII